MSQHHIDMMILPYRLVIGKYLLHIDIECPSVAFGHRAASRSELPVIAVHHRCAPGLVKPHADIEREIEVLQEIHGEIGRTVESIPFRIVLVQGKSLKGIGIGGIRPGHPGIPAIAVVVHFQTIFINHYISGRIPHVYRVYRRHRCGETEHVSGRGTAFAAVPVVPVEIGIGGIGPHLQPFGCLPVKTHPGGITVHVGPVHDALVVEIAERCKDLGVTSASGQAYIVFLPE